MGFYAGAQVHRQGIPSDVINRVLGLFSASNPPSASFVVELCDADAAYGADYTVGFVVNTDGDVHQVQQSVRKWSKGACLAATSNDILGEKLTFLAPAPIAAIPAAGGSGSATNASTLASNSTLAALRVRGLARRQDYCSNFKTVVGTFSLPACPLVPTSTGPC